MTAKNTRATRFTSWVIQHRRVVMLVCLVLAAIGAVRTARTYAGLRSDIPELLPQSAPSVEAMASLKERVRGLRHLGIVIDTGGAQNVPAANRFVDDLQQRILAYEDSGVTNVKKDLSVERAFLETYALQLADLDDVKKLRQSIELRREWEVTNEMGLRIDDDEAPPVVVDGLREKYEKRFGVQSGGEDKPLAAAIPNPDGRFIGRDGKTAVLLVQVSSSLGGGGGDSTLLDRVKQDVADLNPAQYAPGMRVGYAGDVAAADEELRGLYQDLSRSGALVTLLVVLALLWFFRTPTALLMLGVPLACGAVYSFGLVALPPLSITYLNTNTAFLGTIIVGNGVNTGIILLARFAEERGKNVLLSEAIANAVDAVWRPTLAGAAAASAAYGSLVFTDFRGFAQFGWIGGVGMLLCWATTFVMLPALLSWFGGRIRARPPGGGVVARRIAAFIVRRPVGILAATALLVGLSVWGIADRRGDWLEYDLSRLRRSDSWETGERYWGTRMDRALGRYLTPTAVLSPSPESAREATVALRELSATGRAGGLIDRVVSVDDVLRPQREEATREVFAIRQVLSERLLSELKPSERRMVAAATSEASTRPLTAEDLPDAFVAGLRERDGTLGRNVLVYPRLTEDTWDVERIDGFATDLRSAAPDAQVAGSLLLTADIATAMTTDGPVATLLSILAVLAVCIIAFRSLKFSGAAVLSLLLGVLMMLGFGAWIGQRLNFANFMVLPISFGISADYAVNVIKRFQTDRAGGLVSAISGTGGAVALCSLTTIIGYGALLVAQNQALSSFGVFAVAGEVTCLFTAVVSMPCALALMDRRTAPPLRPEPVH